MSKEAMKLALEALEANQPVNYCMNNNGEKFPMMQEDPFKFERNSKAITALREALAEQPAPASVGSLESLKLLMQHSAWEGVIQLSDALKNIDEWSAEQPAQQEPLFKPLIDLHPGLAEELKAMDATAQQEPVAWMEMVVANLVREGVNKHKARELAQHFYTSPPAQRTWVGLTHEEHMEIMTGTMTTSSRMAAVEAKLRSKNNG